MAQLAEPARGARFCAPAAVSCPSYSEWLGKFLEHQEVSARLMGRYVNFRLARPLSGVPAHHRAGSLYVCMKTRTTPIASTKTQALARVLAAVTHGYTRVCSGEVPREKLARLATKFDAKYGIAHTKGQRVINRRAGRANTMFAAYSPPEEYLAVGERLPWILLATQGEGVEEEMWVDVIDRPVWLDYELSRHNDAGEVRWTWRRTKSEMTQLYAELGEDVARRRFDEVAKTLERIANQPGFHGVRSQSQALIEYARRRGYKGPVPHLFYVQKVPNGTPLLLVAGANEDECAA